MAGYSSHNLEAFIDVVRLKSFSAVARKRGLTPSSIARQISSLEEEVGVALFLRSTRSLVPTEAGHLLFERSERILSDLEDAKLAATSLRQNVQGCLRLCCWPTFAKRCVIPHLPELFARYPDLRIDLDLTERLHEPVLSRTDLVIRMGELTDSSLLATKLATQTSIVVASPAYLARHGTPTSLEECASHRLIDKRHKIKRMGWRALLGESRGIMRRLVLQTDDLDAQTQACAAGLGLAFAPSWLFAEQLRSGALVTVAIEIAQEQSTTDIHLLRNPGTPTAAIKAFTEFLRRKLATQLDAAS